MKDYKILGYYEVEEEIRHTKALLKYSERAYETFESFKTQTERLRSEVSELESHFKLMTVPVDTSVDETSIAIETTDQESDISLDKMPDESPDQTGHA
jgi:predicted nuclease with TOPRIM domain